MITFLYKCLFKEYMYWLKYQLCISIKSKYGSLRVHKSTWQVGAVYSFFCYCRKLLINQDIHIRKSKRGPPVDSSLFHKNKRMENQ